MQSVNLFAATRPVQSAWEADPSDAEEDFSSEEKEEEEAQKDPAPAPSKREYFSNFVSKASSLIKTGAQKASTKITTEDEQKIIHVLTEEN